MLRRSNVQSRGKEAIFARVALLFAWSAMSVMFDAVGARAQTDATCQYTKGIASVRVGGSVPVVLELADGRVLVVNDTSCPGMQAGDPLNGITVDGRPGPDDVVADEAGLGGRFSNPFLVDLSDGNDRFEVWGDASGETYGVTSRGLCGDLNAGLTNVETVSFDTGSGDDTVNGGGCTPVVQVATTVTSALIPLTVHGGDGNDNLFGGAASDGLFGQTGDDLLDGGDSRDLLIGGDGADRCVFPDAVSGASATGSASTTSSTASCDPQLTVASRSGSPGDMISFTGSGWFPENGEVRIFFDPSGKTSNDVVWTSTVFPDGSLSGTKPLPALDARTYSIRSCQLCTDDGETAPPVTFDILGTQTSGPSPTSSPGHIAPTLALDPSSVRVGDLVHVSGDGWNPKLEIHVFFDTLDIVHADPAAIAPVDANGHFDTDLRIPQREAGSYVIVACQRCGTGREQSASLTISERRRSRAPWLASIAVAALAAGFITYRRLRPHPAPEEVLTLDPIPGEPLVRVETQSGGGVPSVRLVPHPDPGSQHLEEVPP